MHVSCECSKPVVPLIANCPARGGLFCWTYSPAGPATRTSIDTRGHTGPGRSERPYLSPACDRTIALAAKDRKWRCCFTIGHTPRVRFNNVAQAFHGSSRNEYYDDKLPVENNW